MLHFSQLVWSQSETASTLYIKRIGLFTTKTRKPILLNRWHQSPPTYLVMTVFISEKDISCLNPAMRRSTSGLSSFDSGKESKCPNISRQTYITGVRQDISSQSLTSGLIVTRMDASRFVGRFGSFAKLNPISVFNSTTISLAPSIASGTMAVPVV